MNREADRRVALAPWYALYTRSRHEKKVSERLRARSFEVFLPLVPQVSQWHDRRKVIDTPLFPGYVFVRFEAADTTLVLGTPGVSTVVRQNGAPAPIREEEIEDVQRLVRVVAETGSVPQPEPLVERGDAVCVASGPLQGVRGIVLERRGSGRALLQVGVRAIGQGVKVEVETGVLRPLVHDQDLGLRRTG